MYEPLTEEQIDKTVQGITLVTNKYFDTNPDRVMRSLVKAFAYVNSDDIASIIFNIQDKHSKVFENIKTDLVQHFIEKKASEIIQTVSESAQLPYEVDFDQERDFQFRTLTNNLYLMKAILNEFKTQTEAETDEVLQKAFEKFSASTEELIQQKEDLHAERLVGAEKTFKEIEANIGKGPSKKQEEAKEKAIETYDESAGDVSEVEKELERYAEGLKSAKDVTHARSVKKLEGVLTLKDTKENLSKLDASKHGTEMSKDLQKAEDWLRENMEETSKTRPAPATDSHKLSRK